MSSLRSSVLRTIRWRIRATVTVAELWKDMVQEWLQRFESRVVNGQRNAAEVRVEAGYETLTRHVEA